LRTSLSWTIALPTRWLSVFDRPATEMLDLRVPAKTATAVKLLIATMMNDLVEGMIERDEEGIQVLCYQRSKREDALKARERS